MRKTLVVLVAAMMVGMTIPAFAELQNVQVGGSLRMRVNVSADFTDDVHAFIELDSYDVFGDGFRGLDSGVSTYSAPEARGFGGSGGFLTGFDGSESGTPVNFYHGYVEMREAWGYPV